MTCVGSILALYRLLETMMTVAITSQIKPRRAIPPVVVGAMSMVIRSCAVAIIYHYGIFEIFLQICADQHCVTGPNFS